MKTGGYTVYGVSGYIQLITLLSLSLAQSLRKSFKGADVAVNIPRNSCLYLRLMVTVSRDYQSRCGSRNGWQQ